MNKLLLVSVRQVFTGKEALDQLAVGALVQRSRELTEPPRQRQATESNEGEPATIPAASTRHAENVAVVKKEEEETSSSANKGKQNLLLPVAQNPRV